jgi:hypothetical protein
MSGLAAACAYVDQTCTTRLPPRVYLRLHKRIRDYDPASFKTKFGFNQDHAASLLSCLFPDIEFLRCQNRSVFHIEEAFLIMLYRMTKNRMFTDIQEEFGIEYTQLCRIFNSTIEEIVARHHHLLSDNLAFYVTRLPMYNQAIRNKLGDHMIPCAIDTSLFVDGKSLEIARPGGNFNQRLVYNGHHRVHSLQFVAISAPDGMIVDFYGPVAGRHHDQDVLNESEFDMRFQESQLLELVKYKAYGDKGYISNGYIHGSHKNYEGAPLPPLLLAENNLMHSIRVAVEWTFNTISQKMVYLLGITFLHILDVC